MTPMARFAAAALTAAVALAGPAQAQNLSTSILRPTPVDQATGLVAGKLPGGTGSTSYYVAVDLKAGDLVTQIQVAGRPNSPKRLDFELLDQNARNAASAFVLADSEAKRDATKTYPIDSGRRYVIRLTVEGRETGTFCVLMGGTALPAAQSPGCPPLAAETPPPPPPPVARIEPPAAPPPSRVEVIRTRCEERLRVGSDFLFDFDRAEIHGVAAGLALDELGQRIRQLKKIALIEGHTDAKGTESYNQGLSERRASAVRVALADRGVPGELLRTRGLGKSRPVAPNENPDGSDNPAGREKNRRVEVVIDTCN